MLGIELNPRAAAIAEMVLWIGYLQWHFRTLAGKPAEPVLRDFHNIECRDAVLAYDRVEYVTDERGVPVTRWDEKTTKPSPVTGEPVPDEAARVPVERYVNPRRAEWPQATFVVGNPPFIGTKRMRQALGDGYVDALRACWHDVGDGADFVMFWWHHAAWRARRGWLRRFGFITTNSVRQNFNRRIVELHLQAEKSERAPRRIPGKVAMGQVIEPLTPALSLLFAIPDHPWVDSADGAAVRIAMTVGAEGESLGRLMLVTGETETWTGEAAVTLLESSGRIHSDLRLGADMPSAVPLMANSGISGMGVALHGAGFILEPDEAARLRASGADVIKGYVGGRDLLQVRRERYLIDFSGLGLDEARVRNPAALQRVIDRVKPERDQNSRKSIRELWWRFGWERPLVRRALRGLSRYIGTTETSKHRVFQFIDGEVLADHMVVCVASSDPVVMALLSSDVHLRWSLVAGGTLEDRPRYNKNRCFDPFPFPVLSSALGTRIGDLGESIDTHRKQQQLANPELTLTGIYNVLDSLRRGETLTVKDRVVHQQGLVSVLRELHDELDRAVFAAYGWNDLADKLVGRPGATTPWPEMPPEQAEAEEELLTRLVALNAERAAEEKRGLVRWLRPEFQNPQGTKPPSQDEIDTDADEPAPVVAKPDKKMPWPKSAAEQARAVADALVAARSPLTHDELAARFTGKGPWKKRLPVLLDTLVALGRAHRVGDRVSAL